MDIEYFIHCHTLYSLDIVVCVVTRLRTGQPTDRISANTRDFSFSPERSDRQWGHSSLHFNGHRDYFPEGKAAWPESDHSSPPGAEIKN